MRSVRAMAALTLLLGSAAVGLVGGPPPAEAAGSAAVSIVNFSFQPADLTVPAGTTVTWTNHDQTTHTVTSDSGAFDSGSVTPGYGFGHQFASAGTFTYHCSIHTFMHGTVTVTAGATTTAPPPPTTAPPAGPHEPTADRGPSATHGSAPDDGPDEDRGQQQRAGNHRAPGGVSAGHDRPGGRRAHHRTSRGHHHLGSAGLPGRVRGEQARSQRLGGGLGHRRHRGGRRPGQRWPPGSDPAGQGAGLVASSSPGQAGSR